MRNSFIKKIKKFMATSLALLMALGMVPFFGCNTNDNPNNDNPSEDNNPPQTNEHVCQNVCDDCGNCRNLDCDECKTKCGCSYVIVWNVVNAEASVSEGNLPLMAKYGETIEFSVTAEGPNLEVKVDGQLIQPTNENTYKVIVNKQTKIDITADEPSQEKFYTLTDATVAIRNGKPCYLLKGTYQNYTQDELSSIYFDMQYNASYNDKYGWNTTEVEYELVLTEYGFEIYVDLTSFPTDVCLIPHFGASDSSGDVKIDKNDGEYVIVNGVEYRIDMSANSWGIATVTILNFRDTMSAPSDNTAPQINSITNYNYFATTDIPRIDIATDGGLAIDDKSLIKGWKVPEAVYEYNYIGAQVSVSNCEGYGMENIAAQVKVRGNYTSTYPKKPIRIKFDKKQNMCGLNGEEKFKNWVLLAEYKDGSMLRNSVAFYLGNSILESDGFYCTDFRYVEVYLNGAYNGLYLLVEQQEVKSDRIDLPEAIDPEDEPDNPNLKNVKIGYSIEYDGYYYTEKSSEIFDINYDKVYFENRSWMNPSQRGFTIKSDVYFEEQRAFIQKCVQNIWDIVYDATYKPHKDLEAEPFYTLNADGEKVVDKTIKTPREAVEKVIDVRSLVDTFIINEICQDADLGWSSFYMSLDMSETGNRLLTFEAPWDFDSALGNSVGTNDKFFSLNKSNHGSGSVTPNPWLMILGRETWFWTHVQAKWNALEEANTFTNLYAMIDYFATNYTEVYAKNYQKWPQCIGHKLEGQQQDIVATFKTQAQAAEYLKNWTTERINNLDGLIDKKVKEFLAMS